MAWFSLNFGDNVPPNQSTFDVEFYNPLGSSPGNILQVTCTFRTASTSSNPTITVSTVQGGTGITFALDTTKLNRGDSGTVLQYIPPNNSLWVRFSNSQVLGDGQINLNLSPTVTSIPGLSLTDIDTVISLALGTKEIMPTIRNYFIQNACRFIQNHANLLGMQTTTTFNITSTTGVGPYYFSTIGVSDMKSVASMYIKDNSQPSSPFFILPEYDREKFNENRPDLYQLNNSQNINLGYPAFYNIWNNAFWLQPVAVNTTVTLEYYRILTGANLTYVLTNCPESILFMVMANVELLKPGSDMEKVVALQDLARKILVDQLGTEEFKKVSDSQSRNMRRTG